MVRRNQVEDSWENGVEEIIAALESVKGVADELLGVATSAIESEIGGAIGIHDELQGVMGNLIGNTLGDTAETLAELTRLMDVAQGFAAEGQSIAASTVSAGVGGAMGVAAAYNPYDYTDNPAPECPAGKTSLPPTYEGNLKCQEKCVPMGQFPVDPAGEPQIPPDFVWPDAEKNCCLPICGITPGSDGGGTLPPGDGGGGGTTPSTCPEPTSPEPGETPTGGDVPHVGDTTARCGVDAYRDWANRTTQPGVTESLRVLRALIYGDAEDESKFVESIVKNETSLFPSRQVQGSIQRSLYSAVTRIDEVIGGWIVSSGCFSAEHSLLAVESMLLSVLKLAVGDSLRAITVPLDYKLNSLCPTCYPEHTDAINCFLRGTISRDTFETWVKQNNYCLEPVDRMLDAQQSRLTPTDMLAAWRRKLMDDSRIEMELRNLGFTSPDFREWMKKLTEFVPPIQDLIRFMVRDVETERIYTKYRMDDEFGDKWRDYTKEKGEWQGIDEPTALRYWRAHWQIPSPTQLFEMFHVSRSLPDDHPDKTTLPEVEDALRQQDILPYWIPKLLATTYSRMSRVDVRRAYNLGVISKDQVRTLYVRLGYRDEDASTLTEWTHKEKIKSAAGRSAVKLFTAGLVSRLTAATDLTDIGLTPAEADRVLSNLILSMRGKSLAKCVASLRKRYLLGDISEEEWRGRLAGFGFQPEWADVQIESARCEKESRGKLVPTATLCSWYDEGIIDSSEYTERLVRLGWTFDDALKILTQCSTKINTKRVKEAERIAKQEAANVERMRKEQEREQAKLDRQAKQSGRAREIAEKARQRRTQLLGRATELLSQSASVTVDEAGSAVQESLSRLSSDYLLTADTRVQAIVLSVEKFKPTSLDSFRSHVIEFADELEAIGTLPNL